MEWDDGRESGQSHLESLAMDAKATGGTGSPAYLAGLLLTGRRVVVVGGGNVAARRLPRLLEAGADVLLVAPDVQPAVAELASSGMLRWRRARFSPQDLDGAWYVMAATDDDSTNRLVAQTCEARRVFCVRCDDAAAGSSWTPATEHVGDLTVGVLGRRNPRLSSRVRDAVVAEIRRSGE